MKVAKSAGGSFIDKSKLETGDVIKLVSEAVLEEGGQYGPQLLANCRVKGWEGGPVKIAINTPTKNALIEAFGDDTNAWIDKLLTVSVMEMPQGIALYLIPEGFLRIRDEGGYVVIKRKSDVKIDPPKGLKSSSDKYPDVDINPDDIPF